MGKTILTLNQQKILAEASNDAISTRFYLTGGTALSEFYFRHRLSEDLDFFCQEPLNSNILHEWIKDTAHKLKVRDIEFGELEGQQLFFFHFPDEVIKVDFAYFPFEHLGEYTNYKSIRIASVLDIGVNKIQALITQNRARDYFDLYTILTQGNITVSDLMEGYRKKYDVGIGRQELSKRFVAVADAKDMPRFLGKVDWSLIETFFLDNAKLLVEKYLTD